MRFMEEKAAERHPDCLVSSSAVLQCLQIHEDAIQSVVQQFCKVRHESLQLHGGVAGCVLWRRKQLLSSQIAF